MYLWWDWSICSIGNKIQKNSNSRCNCLKIKKNFTLHAHNLGNSSASILKPNSIMIVFAISHQIRLFHSLSNTYYAQELTCWERALMTSLSQWRWKSHLLSTSVSTSVTATMLAARFVSVNKPRCIMTTSLDIHWHVDIFMTPSL